MTITPKITIILRCNLRCKNKLFFAIYCANYLSMNLKIRNIFSVSGAELLPSISFEVIGQNVTLSG